MLLPIILEILFATTLGFVAKGGLSIEMDSSSLNASYTDHQLRRLCG